MQNWKSLAIGGTILTIMVAGASVGLWLIGQEVGAILLGIALLIAIAVVVSSLWAAALVKLGVEIALRSQESDDRRDAIQIKAVADLAKVLMRQSQLNIPPSLPLPSQQNWLPQLEDFSEGEFGEIE